MTDKSALSRKINVSEDKSYLRKDFISWFWDEVEYASKDDTHSLKVYPQKLDKVDYILQEYNQCFEDDNYKNLIGKFFIKITNYFGIGLDILLREFIIGCQKYYFHLRSLVISMAQTSKRKLIH